MGSSKNQTPYNENDGVFLNRVNLYKELLLRLLKELVQLLIERLLFGPINQRHVKIGDILVEIY